MGARAQACSPHAGSTVRHWKEIWSINPLSERLNREIKRPNDVVGVFPKPEGSSGSPGPSLPKRATIGRSPINVIRRNHHDPLATRTSHPHELATLARHDL
jgi:hypothetical protein